MNSCTIELTPAAKKHGNIYLTKCPKDFFPKDIYGASSSKKGKKGNPISLQVAGRDEPVETDIPLDAQTGKPRRFFRDKKWVKEFLSCHKLKPKDKVIIERVSKRTYRLKPTNSPLVFIDLFGETLVRGLKPLVKWAGGKSTLISTLKPLLPKSFSRYCEPFIGGGALFWDIAIENSIISDSNEELIHFYTTVRDCPNELIETVGSMIIFRKELCH